MHLCHRSLNRPLSQLFHMATGRVSDSRSQYKKWEFGLYSREQKDCLVMVDRKQCQCVLQNYDEEEATWTLFLS